MKQKKSVLIIAVVLSVIAAWYFINTKKSTISEKDSAFAIADTASVTKIFMADKFDNHVTLTRENGRGWVVDHNQTVSTPMINLLLETMHRIRVKYPVPKRKRNTVLKRMASNSVKVEVYQDVFRIDLWGIQLFEHEKLTKTYYVGGATQDNLGTHMLIEGADDPFVVDIPGFRGYVASRYSTLSYKWRNHDIFSSRLSEISSISLDFPEQPELSFTISNTGGKMDLTPHNQVKAPRVDTLKMLNFMSSFSDINFESFLNHYDEKFKDSILNSQPFHIFTLITKDGDTTHLKTFHQYSKYGELDLETGELLYDSDRFYGYLNGTDFILLQFFTFDKITRDLTYFAPRQSY